MRCIGAVLLAAAPLAGTARGQSEAPGGEDKPISLAPRVAYISEVPYQWQGEQGNPLEWWARELTLTWAGTTGSLAQNLIPELSWERLTNTCQERKVEAIVIHGYEFFEQREAAGLELLLVPRTNGKPGMAEFVILRNKPPKPTVNETRPPSDQPSNSPAEPTGDGAGKLPPRERPFTMRALDGARIFVDRGGCGELVYRWLDMQILLETGFARREKLAQFHSANSATEAVLSVFFSNGNDACVVSREGFEEVLRHNPEGLMAKLKEVRSSPRFLSHVIACPSRNTANRADIAASRKALISTATAPGVIFRSGASAWTLGVPRPEDSATVEELVSDWMPKFNPAGMVPATGPDQNAPRAPSARAEVPPVTGRRRG